jgi:1,4-dihydroxy-2-naphthoate octaprenyltransferase
VSRDTLVRVCWQASRPSQLVLVSGVYLLGGTVAAGLGATWQPATVALGLAPLLPLAASIHYANEYADVETDARTTRTPFSGGSGALPTTGLSRRVVLRAAVGTLLVGTSIALGLWLGGRLPTAALVLLGVGTVFGWQYSVGPLALAWHGLGELDNAALGGLVLPVYGAAVIEGPSPAVALAMGPFFLVVLLNLFATQWPDREADAAVGKETLAVKWSRRRLRRTYAAVALLAGSGVVALHPWLLPTPVAVSSAVIAPLLVVGARGYTRRRVPWPTVTAMVGLAAVQLLAWAWVAA